MELNINQNCQLVITGNWDVPNLNNTEDKVELLVNFYDPSVYKIEINRDLSTALVWDLEKDGYYKYFQINLPQGTNIKSEELISWALVNYLNLPSNSTDFVVKDFFSICKLRNCVLQLEKEAIHNFINNCKLKNCKKLEGQSNKDILLMAIFVLEHLIARERFTEANMILESMPQCETLCKSINIKTCNCNG